MNVCPHCNARLEPASYMHDASNTTWFDAICGSCGYHTESAPTREARAAVAELIEAIGPALYELRDKSEAKKDLIAALSRVKGA